MLFLAITAFWATCMLVDQHVQRRIGRLECTAILNSAILAIAGVVQTVSCIQGGTELTDLTQFMRYFATGYYICDLPRCRPVMLLHHAVTIAIFTCTPDLAWFVAALLLLEIPVPPLNCALWMRNSGRVIPQWLKVGVVVSYFIPRVVLFPIAIYCNLDALMAVHPLLPAPYIVLATLSTWWFYEICSKC